MIKLNFNHRAITLEEQQLIYQTRIHKIYKTNQLLYYFHSFITFPPIYSIESIICPEPSMPGDYCNSIPNLYLTRDALNCLLNWFVTQRRIGKLENLKRIYIVNDNNNEEDIACYIYTSLEETKVGFSYK